MKKIILAIVLVFMQANVFADAKVPSEILYKDYQTFRNQDWFQYYLEGLFDGIIVMSHLAKGSGVIAICPPDNFSTNYKKALSIIDEYAKNNAIEASKQILVVLFTATAIKYPCK